MWFANWRILFTIRIRLILKPKKTEKKFYSVSKIKRKVDLLVNSNSRFNSLWSDIKNKQKFQIAPKSFIFTFDTFFSLQLSYFRKIKLKIEDLTSLKDNTEIDLNFTWIVATIVDFLLSLGLAETKEAWSCSSSSSALSAGA